jgi:hypothetical protein
MVPNTAVLLNVHVTTDSTPGSTEVAVMCDVM